MIDTGGFARSVDVNRRGVIAGVEAGYNLIAGEFLLGIEGDAAWTPVAGVGELTRVTFFPFGPPRLVSTTAEQSSTWLATLRARAGFKVTEKLLVYGTGGLAVGDTRLTTNLTIVSGNFGCDPGSCFEAVSEGVRAGFALGAGYEYEIAPGTHWKTDYLYTDLGKRTARIIDPADATLFYEGTAEFQTHSVRTAIVFDF